MKMKWIRVFKMKRYFCLGLSFLCLLLLSLSGCSYGNNMTSSGGAESYSFLPPAQEAITEFQNSSAGEEAKTAVAEIVLTVNGKNFEAEIKNTETAWAFLALLPLKIEMKELNGNEKYYYFSQPLPSDSRQPGTVEVGQLMLYGGNCLVLFYESFSTTYSYTPIGKIGNPAGLKAALGDGSAEIAIDRK